MAVSEHSEDRVSATTPQRIAVVTMGVKLGDEVKGYTRFRTIAEMLVDAGYEVDLITSSFQHWEKAQRDVNAEAYRAHPFNVLFIGEPGYTRNLDPRRIYSHHVAAKNLRTLFEERFAEDPHAYDLIYAEIPPNDIARVCGEVAQEHDIPFVVDVNDLWPEAMRMALDIPIISDILFAPFAADAKRTYEMITAAVGTSDEYAERPVADRDAPYERRTVYVGNDLEVFDEGVRVHGAEVSKPDGELWVSYAGMLGASYDLETLIRAAGAAADVLEDDGIVLRLKILGDGPDKQRLEELAGSLNAPVDFLGYTPYDEMAAWLSASDILVNSLVRSAPQSIVTKIGDYVAAGRALINTGSSPEFKAKVDADGIGINVLAEDVPALAAAIIELAQDEGSRTVFGHRARCLAEQEFDRKVSYGAIVELIDGLVEKGSDSKR